MADVLLRAAPGLRVLATSREALGLEGEHVVRPAARDPGGPGREQRGGRPAVRRRAPLRRSSAWHADPRFALTPANVEAVVQVCVRLDGVPLAIELAAARIRAMSAADIRRRLDDCFQLLTAGARGALPRHQTLRAAVDWSHELLSGPERTLFRRLAHFRGGFDVEAAEGTAGFGDLSPSDVLDHLSRLIEKVAGRERAGGGRHRALPGARAAAPSTRRRSWRPRARPRRRRAATWLTTRSSPTAPTRSVPRGPPSGSRASSGTTTTCARHSTGPPGTIPDGELRLAGALAWMWQLHSHFSEGRRWLRRVLERPRGRTREAARALWGASSLAVWQGDLAGGAAPGEEGLAIWRELGDKREVAMALEPTASRAGWQRTSRGPYEAFEEELAIYRELGDERLANRATLNICQVLVSEARVDEAEPLPSVRSRSPASTRELREIHNAHHFLADCALIRGDEGLAGPALCREPARGRRVRRSPRDGGRGRRHRDGAGGPGARQRSAMPGRGGPGRDRGAQVVHPHRVLGRASRSATSGRRPSGSAPPRPRRLAARGVLSLRGRGRPRALGCQEPEPQRVAADEGLRTWRVYAVRGI